MMSEAEIQQLQLTVVQIQQERDRALESASRWRRCYEVEAQQRRKEAETSEQQIKQLRAEVQQMLRLGPAVHAPSTPPMLPSSGKDEHDQVVRLLTAEITKLRQECTHLSNALAQEKEQHAQTRSNFITALGDVVQQGKMHHSSSRPG